MQGRTCDVVHVVNQMRPGGIETMVLDIVQLSRHSSRVFSLEGTTTSLLGGWPGLASIAGSLDGFERQPGLVPTLTFRIASRLREIKPRLVFLHRISPLLYGGLAARLAGIKTIVHVEHDIWQYEDARRRKLLQWSTRLVRPKHIAVSATIADALTEMLPSPDVRVVPGGVDLDRFRPRDRAAARASLGLPAAARIVGTAGRLEQVKGHRVLVSALNHLPTDVHVVILGDGSQRDNLAALARDIGAGDRLHLLGHRDNIELILPAYDIFCLPSLGEGLPRVLMEAQGADIPVVASDVGSVRQVVDPATGRLVPPSDPEALARAVAASLAASSAPGACRSYAENQFGIERMVSEYDSLLLA